MTRLPALLPLLMLLGQALPKPGLVIVTLEGMKNSRGIIRACLITEPSAFPDCARDPQAIRINAPASARELRFAAVPPGRHAIALFHDENSNGKLDKLLGIPREGFGFSRDPVVRFRAPRFDQASITVGGAITRLHIRLQYLL